MKERLSASFYYHNATQFFGALNDNIFKLFIIFSLLSFYGQEYAGTVIPVANAIFVIPFLLFTPFAGILADKISKRTIIVWTKYLEIFVMAFGILAFWANRPFGMYIVLFMMSLQSAFFGPAKYGIIPEIVHNSLLSRANSLLVTFTFLAIIFGSAFSPLLSYMTGRNYSVAALFCVGIAIAGTLTSLRINKTPAPHHTSSLTIADITRTFKDIGSDKYLFFSVAATVFFYMLGAYIQLNLLDFGLNILSLSREQSSYLYLFAAFGIGFGSFAAGRLSGHVIEFGLIPISSLLLAVSTMLFVLTGSIYTVMPTIFIAGMSAGVFVVPLQSFIQYKSPHDELGKILAVSGFMNWVGILSASGIMALFNIAFRLNPAQGFLAMGSLTLILAIIILFVFPNLIIRSKAMIMYRMRYSIELKNETLLRQAEAPVLVTENPLSCKDSLLIVNIMQNTPFFYHEQHQRDKWLSKLRVDSPDAVHETLRQGHPVCVTQGNGLLKHPVKGHPVIAIRIERTGHRKIIVSCEEYKDTPHAKGN
ncbi:MAG: MFS transporter [Candidatus Auribacterota bacterium]